MIRKYNVASFVMSRAKTVKISIVTELTCNCYSQMLNILKLLISGQKINNLWYKKVFLPYISEDQMFMECKDADRCYSFPYLCTFKGRNILIIFCALSMM